jgi:hemoglobin
MEGVYMQNRFARILSSALVLLVVASGIFAAPAGKTLYDRLGKKKGITAVVDDFVGRCAGDTRIAAFFKPDVADPARLKKFKDNLVAQICQASGGPCKYTGKDMKTAHAGMGISTADFNALVEDLVAALNKFKVADADQKALLGVLGPMKSDIVEKP